jgi:secondary thiamine-phosphate synthase enzyme
MRQFNHTLFVRTPGQALVDITGEVAAWVRETGVANGLLTLFIQHTSASLVVQENADPDVLRDLNEFFRRLVREDAALYRHSAEGADDMPAHIRAALTQVHLSIPVIDASMALGTWQAIYVFEHRAHPHDRQVVLHLWGQ